jgi:hypothetical protein
MSWCWLDLVAEPEGDPIARARAFAPDGSPAGWLCGWRRGRRPTRAARRVDARIIDPSGAAAWISYVRPADGIRLPFDDMDVHQARRVVLAARPLDGVTTLLMDASHFEGALTVARGPRINRLADDPFARIFPARILRIEAGVLGRMTPPPGPTIERYGSANPWPWDRFT